MGNKEVGIFKGIGLLILLHIIFFLVLTAGEKIGIVDDGAYYICTVLFGATQFIYVLPTLALLLFKKQKWLLFGVLVGSAVTILINVILPFIVQS
jgi:hypothetical protein